MTSLKDSKLSRAFSDKTLPEIWTACYDFCISGKNVNVQDVETKETYMHLLANQISKFTGPDGVTVIYIMACKGVDMDIQDTNGDTFLHRVVRIPGTFRVIIAAMRTGADPSIRNNEGKTPEEILMNDKPPGWKENLHWLRKFLPGLYIAMNEKVPDRPLVERLLKSWCRTTVIKQKKPYSLKRIGCQEARTNDLVRLIEKYENTNEFVLAILSGRANIINKWIDENIMENIDINTKDYSYQYNYSEFPDVPQPLLARAWEINQYGVIDILMKRGVDTNTLFTYEGKDENPKPLFFQLISGKAKPNDGIVHRILVDCDLNVRNTHGQTIIFEAIEQDCSETFIKYLFKLGINVAARDKYGRTARDHAAYLKKTKYFNVIDDHVLQFVRDCNIERVESLIIQGYRPLVELRDSDGLSTIEIAKRRCSRQLIDVVEKVKNIREHIRDLFEAVQSGKLSEVKKISGKKLAAGQDLCGRTVLHKAILNQNKDIVQYLISEYPYLLNIKDNLGRTPMHYSQLFFEDGSLDDLMIEKGVDTSLKDAMGRTPLDYKCDVCGKRTFCELQKEVLECDLDVYLAKSHFEMKLNKAIQEGKIEKIKKLIPGYKARGDIKRYSNCLFDCIDNNQEEIAIYLILEGMNTDIFKQYEKCDPNNPLCSMLECSHGVVSFKERAKEKNCENVLDLLDELVETQMETSQRKKLPDVKEFSKYGLL